MSNLLYLGLTVAISGIGVLVLWLRHRRPRSLESGIEEFQRELRALSNKPLADKPDDRRRSTG